MTATKQERRIAPALWVEAFGEADLIGGWAEVALDRDFAALVECLGQSHAAHACRHNGPNRLERSDMFKLATATVLLATCLAAPAHADPCALSASTSTQLQSTLRSAAPFLGTLNGRRGQPPSLTLVDANGRPCTFPPQPPIGGDATAAVGLGKSSAQASPADALSVGAISLPLAGSGALAGAATQQTPRAIDLGTLGGGFSAANALNDRGDVVGSSITPDFLQHAFVWHNRTMQDLGTLGGLHSRAMGINNHAQVVGFADTASGETHAFLWRIGAGTMIDLGTLGGSFSIATAINDDGVVVGASTTAGGGEFHAFIWVNGVMTDLGSVPGGSSYARAINERGHAAGWAHNAAFEQHAFRWQRQRAAVDLGTPPGFTIAEAAGININGVVVGLANNAVHDPHAFMWKQGVWTDLGAAFPTDWTDAAGINDDGDVVGSVYLAASSGATHALVWNRRGVATDLNALIGGDYSDGRAINSQGHVVGMAQLPGSSEFHAYLLRR